MHFDILVEDQSGKKMLDIVVARIINNDKHSYKVYSYKGIGHLPRGLQPRTDAQKRILLDQLPKLLQGFGATYNKNPNYPAALIVICDLDRKDKDSFLAELNNMLDLCHPKPQTRFCLAIEEGEAWILGDIKAIKLAYPNARESVLTSYRNDSICGTWEVLADAIYKGGSVTLNKKGWQTVGAEKTKWAETICIYMNVEDNTSPSFVYFRDEIRNFL